MNNPPASPDVIPALQIKTAVSVPCGGCTRCCQRDMVRLLPADDASQYQTEPHPLKKGELMLAHKPDGSCVYVTDTGCSIHGSQPLMCKQMDCRQIAAVFGYTVARKYARAGKLPMPVYERGRELLRKDGGA